MPYGTVHDLGTRHALSQTLDRALHARHATAVHWLAAVRDFDRLRQAWADALAAGDPAPALWAVLTHPMGPERQTGVLFEARHWALRARRSPASVCSAWGACQVPSLDTGRSWRPWAPSLPSTTAAWRTARNAWNRSWGAAGRVFCQAGCLNRMAYHRLKGHCRRQRKPGLFELRQHPVNRGQPDFEAFGQAAAVHLDTT